MFYPQGNFYSPGNLAYPQGPQGGYPQSAFGSPQQGAFGSPQQGAFDSPQGGFGQQGFGQGPNGIPFANTLYGYPQQTPHFAQGFAPSQQPFAPSQPFAPPQQQVSHLQQLAQQQAALQQQALLQLLAQQLAAHSLTSQHPSGIAGINSSANGAGQPVFGWQQSQVSPEQINATLLHYPQQHYPQQLHQQQLHQQQLLQQQPQQLQRLAQYHHWVAQQFAQLAAQQAAQYSGSPYPAQFIPGGGQFVPNQVGGNFVPGITMH
jgi:hypothetical protein